MLSGFNKNKDYLKISFEGRTSSTFDPSFTIANSRIIRTEIGSSVYNTNSISLTFSNEDIFNSRFWLRDWTDVTNIDMNNDDIVGKVDISKMSKLTYIDFVGNGKITEIVNPISNTSSVTYYRAAGIFDLSGTLDLSGYTNLGGSIYLNNNPYLTGIINPTSSNTITVYYANNNCLTGTLSLSGLTGLGGDIRVNNNPNLVGISNPTTSRTITYYDASYCNLKTLDLSMMSGLGGTVNLNDNSKLTSVTFPTTPNSLILNLNNCDLDPVLDVRGLTAMNNFSVRDNPRLRTIMFTQSNTNWSYFDIRYSGVEGVLDVSSLKLGGQFLVSSTYITNIINPTSSLTFTSYWADNCNLTGTLDLRPLSGLGGSITLSGNKKLTQVLNPTTSVAISNYNLSSCDLTGTLDMSGITNCSYYELSDNPNLNYIVTPTSSTNISYFNVSSCDLIGTLDLRSLSNLGGNVKIMMNGRLTNVMFPTASNVNITNLDLGYSAFQGTMDLSGLKLGGYVYMYQNIGLESVIVSTTSNTINMFDVTSCDINGTLDLRPLLNLGAVGASNNPRLTQVLLPTASNTTAFYYSSGGWTHQYSNIAGGWPGIVIANCNLTGTLDISGIKLGSNLYPTPIGSNPAGHLISTLNVSNNRNLGNVIINNTYNDKMVQCVISDCNLSSFDLTGQNALYAFYSQRNPNLTSITNPTMSLMVTDAYNASYCNLTGTISFANMSLLRSGVNLSYNPNLIGVIMPQTPNTSVNLTSVNISNCNITGVFDGSKSTNMYDIDLSDNPNLTGYLCATHSHTFSFRAIRCRLGYIDFRPMSNILNLANSNINIQSNGMSASTVNRILYELNSITSVSGALSNRYLYIHGNNAAPDSSSGGYDGIAAKNALVAKGVTVTTS